MNYTTLSTLNTVLKNLQSDAATLGLTISSLMIVISVIVIMFDTDTNVAAHGKRWDKLRMAFIGAALITAAGTILTFSQQLGGGIHA